MKWNKFALCVSFRPTGASVHPCAVAPIAMVTITQQHWWKHVSCRRLCRSSLPHHVCLPPTGREWVRMSMCVRERTRWKQREKRLGIFIAFRRAEREKRDLIMEHYAFLSWAQAYCFFNSILIIISLLSYLYILFPCNYHLILFSWTNLYKIILVSKVCLTLNKNGQEQKGGGCKAVGL